MRKRNMDNSQYSGRVIVAVMLIGLGVLSLMGIGLLWPLFILVPGLLMLAGAFGGGRTGAAALAIPGMIVTGTGALLFAQNLTGYWESWSYAWTLYGAFLGMGFMLMGQKFEDDSLHRVGRGFVNVSLVMFTVFAFFFEIVIGISGRGPLNALILIGLGLFLMTRGSLSQRIAAALDRGDAGKPKRKVKTKRDDDRLFTGPIVYGTHVTSRSASRLSVSDNDDPTA
jgi:hypothetical protein